MIPADNTFVHFYAMREDTNGHVEQYSVGHVADETICIKCRDDTLVSARILRLYRLERTLLVDYCWQEENNF